MESSTCSSQEAPVAAHVPERRRRHDGAAAARIDGAGRDAAGADGRHAAGRGSDASTSRTAPRWTSGRRDATAPASSSRKSCSRSSRSAIASNIISDLSHPQAYGGGSATVQPQPLGRHVPERRACRGRAAGASRHHDGPARRAADRPGHAAAVARADDRGRRAELRRRPQLRVPRHDFVAGTDVAAADAEQPAGGLRAAVRRRQHRCRAAGAAAAVAQPARFGARRGHRRCRRRLPASDRSRVEQYLDDVREIERRIQKAARAGVHRSHAAATRRPAFRRMSKSTSS